MPDFLISLIAVVVILGFMILIHEFGHYAVAKWLGVRVEVFSIGFGKRLLGYRKGETDYRISAIPLGGYVKMSGENPMDERTGDPAEFLSHSALAPLPHRHRWSHHEHHAGRVSARRRLHGALRISCNLRCSHGDRMGDERYSRGESWLSDPEIVSCASMAFRIPAGSRSILAKR